MVSELMDLADRFEVGGLNDPGDLMARLSGNPLRHDRP